MIRSELFYASFEAGLLTAGLPAGVTRSGGKIPKYTANTLAGKLKFWFKVNGKASAIPHQPGDFCPEIEADKKLRCDERDSGLVSWYQYTDEAMHEAFRTQQRRVFDKTAAQADFSIDLWRQTRDIWVNITRESLAFPFAAGFPHTRLHYLDEADARQWGVILGSQFSAWLDRFNVRPETLQRYMWRVHWADGKHQTGDVHAG